MMPDASILALLLGPVLLLLAGGGLMAARSAKAEVARLRAAAQEAQRALEGARTQAEVARERAEGQGKLLADRDGALSRLRAEAEAHRAAHRDAEARCAKAEADCAQASEGVKRLEAAAERLRQDHAEILRTTREEGARTTERLRAVEEEFGRLSAAHARLQTERDERLASAEREVARLATLREDMTKEFQALAAATLQRTGAQFSEAHHQKLTELLTPFREQVGRFEAELRAVHQEADKDRAILVEQIRAVSEQARAVGHDAQALAQALKGDKQRQGAWGEAQLERYLELMGFRRGVDYTVQETRTSEEGDRKRPDVVLRLPGDKTLVIDSKVSLNAYAHAISAETEEERARWLRLHAQNVRARIDELAARDYHQEFDGSVDWVLLFMPVEGAVAAAWDETGEVAAYAMERGVGLAYPTTLLMALRTVRHIWNVEKRNKNAEQIAERAGRLYDKLATFIESFGRVGAALDTARKAHDTALGQLTRGNGNLVRQVEQLRALGARTGKAIAIPHDGEGGAEEAEVPPPPEREEGVRRLPAAE